MGDEAKENGCILSPCSKRLKLDASCIETLSESEPKASPQLIETKSEHHQEQPSADECSLQLELREPEVSAELELEHELSTEHEPEPRGDSAASQPTADDKPTEPMEEEAEDDVIVLSDDDNDSSAGNNRTENNSSPSDAGSNGSTHSKTSTPSPSSGRRLSSNTKTSSNQNRSSSACSSHKKAKLSDADRAIRQEQRARKLEERRIRAEQLQAAKELKKKEREALAEKRKLEKEQALREKEEQRRAAMEKKKAEEEAKKQREKEREEQRRLALEKKKAEEEAKRQREKEREQRRKEEEEKKEQRRREEEERREKKRKELEVEELRKKRESDRFLSFFSKVEQRPVITYAASVDAAGAECGAGPALPFELKEGMRVAPIQRRPALSPHTYDHLLDNDESTVQSRNSLYLSNVPRRRTTSPKRNEMRAKLFQFHDNYRPPYYGTWRKRSKTITGRRPFGRDTKILDYDVDSDEEWEDEPEGEEIGDENNQSDESEDSDDENDGFFVEHGYLSDGEGSGNEAEMDDSGSVVHEDEAERKRRLHAVAEDWKNSMKQRSIKTKLIPLLYGPVFGENPNGYPQHLQQFLQPICFFNYD